MRSCIDRLPVLLLSSTVINLASFQPLCAGEIKLAPGPYALKNLESGKRYYAIVDPAGKMVSLSEKSSVPSPKTVPKPAPAVKAPAAAPAATPSSALQQHLATPQTSPAQGQPAPAAAQPAQSTELKMPGKGMFGPKEGRTELEQKIRNEASRFWKKKVLPKVK